MLKVDRLEKSYKTGGVFSRKRQKILKNISFECERGECLGIIGESGSGKSTLGRLLIGIEKPDKGTVLKTECRGATSAARRHKRCLSRL